MAEHDRQRQVQLAAIYTSVLIATVVLLVFGQLLAALLVVIVGALVLEIERRNRRARALAQQLVAGQALEKLEVPTGAWGELCRAINTVVQERRVQEHSRTTFRLASDRTGQVANDQRTVAVLLVSCVPNHTRTADPESSVMIWRALASATERLAQAHGALLQPCGDAIMLVFGAHGDRPIEDSLLAAEVAAESLSKTWRIKQRGPLAMSMSSGIGVVASLPGLGCCVLGAPVEQAVQIERLALASPYYRLLCDESAYYALRHHGTTTWRPTEFRIRSGDGRAQVVYGSSVA